MVKRTNRYDKVIIYDAKCAHCGISVNTPKAWKEHKNCERRFRSSAQCTDCRSLNLQPAGGCLVCMECGWESCKG